MRKCDSFFNDASAYIDEYLDILNKKLKDGSIVQYLVEKQKLQMKYGSSVFIVVEKPKN